MYLEPPDDQVQEKGNDCEEVDKVHGLLEEPPLPGGADKPDHVFKYKEKDGEVF